MAEQEARDRVVRRWVVVRMLLVLALSGAIVFWPYPSGCGFGLLGFLASTSAVALGGLWIATLSWQQRMPITHAVSMLVLIWALAIAARETLPRIGYARPDAARVAWHCSP